MELELEELFEDEFELELLDEFELELDELFEELFELELLDELDELLPATMKESAVSIRAVERSPPGGRSVGVAATATPARPVSAVTNAEAIFNCRNMV